MTTSPLQLEKVTEHMTKSFEEMNAFSREGLDLAIKSVATVTKGWDETTRSAATLVQESFARLMSANKSILGAKSPREAMEIHAESIKESIDHAIAGTGRITEISARVFKEAVEPIAQHANNAVSKIMEKARAA